MNKKNKSMVHSLLKPIFLMGVISGLIDLVVSQSKICKTSGCSEAAQLVLKNMDKTIDPCDNFYQFACGNFVKETVIPDDEAGVMLHSRKTDILQEKLKQTIEGKLAKSDPKTFKLLQSYYNVCLNTEKIEANSLKEVESILNDLGSWPVVVGKSWNQADFDWQKLVYQLRRLGYTSSMRSIINVQIKIDQKNTTRYVLTLGRSVTGLDIVYLLKGSKDKVVQAYFKHMVDLAKIFGVDKKQAEKELADSLEFEIKLAKLPLVTDDGEGMSRFYNPKTVKQLQSEYPSIPWVEYLNQLLSPQSRIELTDEVIVRHPRFLQSLSQLLSKTPKRVLANYMIWAVIYESTDYMTQQVDKVRMEFYASMTGTNVEQSRSIKCINYVSDNLPLATGALYVRKNFDKKIKGDVEKLVIELRKSFRNMLKKVDWMDEETKKAAETKLDAIETHVAYPDEFLDNSKLDGYFENLKVEENSFLRSHLRLNLFNWENKLEQLQKPANKTSWLTGQHGTVALVNAHNEPTENSVQIPAGILQGEFYTNTRPNYMNYGAIGWIIGHEMTHSFDDEGSQYDKDGNLASWWNIETKKEFLKRAKCIIDQYSSYTVKEVGLNINGENTQNENIADNGGIKESYYAYEEFERQNGEEPRLPGLNQYSPRQMFWISAANVRCNKFRTKALKNNVLTDVHSPGEFRIFGPFSNMVEFAIDFKCSPGSPMNPVEKCTVW